MNITLDAYAKVNLYLGVEPVVVKGRHKLHSVFVTVSLKDTLEFAFVGSTETAATNLAKPAMPEGTAPSVLPVKIAIDANPALNLQKIANDDNSITKAVRAFEAAFMMSYGRSIPASSLQVKLEKRIPAQAGLGGGSADAAATIKALAQLCGLSEEKDANFLHQVARQVGADVAFFLTGGCALMAGFGDVLQRRLPMPDPPLNLVLVKPAAGVSTAAAYQVFSTTPTATPAVSLDPLLEILESGGIVASALRSGKHPSCPAGTDELAYISALAHSFANNLEPAAFALLPEIASLIDALNKCPGVLTSRVCGSGSTVFAVCANPGNAKAIAEDFARRGFWSQAVQTISAS